MAASAEATRHIQEHSLGEAARIGRLSRIREFVLDAQDGLFVPLGVVTGMAARSPFAPPSSSQASPRPSRERSRWAAAPTSQAKQKSPHQAHPYKLGTWGPKQADILIAPTGHWHNPIPAVTNLGYPGLRGDER